MSTRASEVLFSPPPSQIRGWGRFVRILCQYPIAPLEASWGIVAAFRGLYVFSPIRDAAVAPAWNALAAYGVNIDLFAVLYLFAGLLQLMSACYEWQRLRVIGAALLFGLTIPLVGRTGVGAFIHLPMLLVQGWIVSRSVPLFRPGKRRGP